MSNLGGLRIAARGRPAIVGILNASPESFLASSIRTTRASIAEAASRMENDGADIIDIGGMSSAPYAPTLVPERTEAARVIRAMRAVQSRTNVPISVDTCRATVAKAALDEGAGIINDITGLQYDSRMRDVITQYAPSLILCAYSGKRMARRDPIAQTARLLEHSMRIASECGIASSRIALDPSIGFFRRTGRGRRFTRYDMDWALRDLLVLGRLDELASMLRAPLLVSASNKSFVGRMMRDAPPGKRLAGSLAAEITAVIRGARLIRTHNVAQTRQTLDMLNA